jgi:hypothetical protein
MKVTDLRRRMVELGLPSKGNRGALLERIAESYLNDSLPCMRCNALEERVKAQTMATPSSRVYDPCGLISPVLLLAKSFLQSLWLHPLEWDSVLPRDLAATWDKLLKSLLSSPPFSIPRTFSTHSGSLQLHGFCDASKCGYAAVLYVRSLNRGSVSLLIAKSRVAPLKLLSIPRLELQGAHLLSKLYNHFCSLFKPSNLLSDQAYLWCDSSVVLTWIRTQPHTLQTFVANRVADIQDTTLYAPLNVAPRSQ